MESPTFSRIVLLSRVPQPDTTRENTNVISLLSEEAAFYECERGRKVRGLNLGHVPALARLYMCTS